MGKFRRNFKIIKFAAVVIKSQIEKEKKKIEIMIQMYCRKLHNPENQICQSCLVLYEYAEKRLENCQFGENKPTCKNCHIHCYKPDMREEIRKVMRYAGPRMIYPHPIKGFHHLFKKFKKIEEL